MASNARPTDPKFIDQDDLDTEGHLGAGVSPTEDEANSTFPRMVEVTEDDTEGHLGASVSPTGDEPTGLRHYGHDTTTKD